MNSPILFLGLPGVMYSKATYNNNSVQGYILFDPVNVKSLNRIVKAVSPRIMIISEASDLFAFQEHYSLDEMRDEFKKAGGLGEIFGETGGRTHPDDTECPVEITTGEDIDGCIGSDFGQVPDHPECKFAILDCRDDLDKHRDRFVQTSDSVGLTDQDADRVIELLRE